jgi:hypothetical protein
VVVEAAPGAAFEVVEAECCDATWIQREHAAWMMGIIKAARMGAAA